MTMSESGVIPSHYGFAVGVMERPTGGFIYAEVVPAPRWNWRPWTGRTARWWYEVHATSPEADEIGCHAITYAYEPGGSGGSFTLRGCLVRAEHAVNTFGLRVSDDDA